MENLCRKFDSRFQDFGQIEPVVTFFLNPFNNTASPSTTAVTISDIFFVPQGNLELEILILQFDLQLKARRHENHFWSFADASRYPHLRDIALRLNPYFGSTYLCGGTFSRMKYVKSKCRTRPTNIHLEDCLRLATTLYTPKYAKLDSDKHCHCFH